MSDSGRQMRTLAEIEGDAIQCLRDYVQRLEIALHDARHERDEARGEIKRLLGFEQRATELEFALESRVLSPEEAEWLISERDGLQAEVARLRAALAVYADEDCWTERGMKTYRWKGEQCFPWTIAQEALCVGGATGQLPAENTLTEALSASESKAMG